MMIFFTILMLFVLLNGFHASHHVENGPEDDHGPDWLPSPREINELLRGGHLNAKYRKFLDGPNWRQLDKQLMLKEEYLAAKKNHSLAALKRPKELQRERHRPKHSSKELRALAAARWAREHPDGETYPLPTEKPSPAPSLTPTASPEPPPLPEVTMAPTVMVTASPTLRPTQAPLPACEQMHWFEILRSKGQRRLADNGKVFLDFIAGRRGRASERFGSSLRYGHSQFTVVSALHSSNCSEMWSDWSAMHLHFTKPVRIFDLQLTGIDGAEPRNAEAREMITVLASNNERLVNVSYELADQTFLMVKDVPMYFPSFKNLHMMPAARDLLYLQKNISSVLRATIVEHPSLPVDARAAVTVEVKEPITDIYVILGVRGEQPIDKEATITIDDEDFTICTADRDYDGHLGLPSADSPLTTLNDRLYELESRLDFLHAQAQRKQQQLSEDTSDTNVHSPLDDIPLTPLPTPAPHEPLPRASRSTKQFRAAHRNDVIPIDTALPRAQDAQHSHRLELLHQFDKEPISNERLKQLTQDLVHADVDTRQAFQRAHKLHLIESKHGNAPHRIQKPKSPKIPKYYKHIH